MLTSEQRQKSLTVSHKLKILESCSLGYCILGILPFWGPAIGVPLFLDPAWPGLGSNKQICTLATQHGGIAGGLKTRNSELGSDGVSNTYEDLRNDLSCQSNH